jgi:hypothetical protein
MKHFNVEKIMEREEKQMERRKAAIQRTIERLNRLDEAREALIASLNEQGATTTGSGRVSRSSASGKSTGVATGNKRVARRGLLTHAVLALFNPKKKAMRLTSDEIIGALSKDKVVTKIPDWQKRVYQLINTNKKRFERVGQQEFKVNERPKDSTLFANIAEEANA